MSMSCGKDKARPGRYAYEVHCHADLFEFGGDYPTLALAEQAARFAYRELHRLGFRLPAWAPYRNDWSPDDPDTLVAALQGVPT